MAKPVFLSAEWRKLAMANYIIDPRLLEKFVPAKTELDFWNERCYVSLVGFMFLNTRLKNIPVPFHRNFPEVNLRFYVRFKDGSEWKRGVVFIKEIVPLPALTFVANMVYQEKYETMPMRNSIEISDKLKVSYQWKKNTWHSFHVEAESNSAQIESNSEEEFITEHFWGYTQLNDNLTSEYQVEHPRWNVYTVKLYEIKVDYGLVYGDGFDFLRVEKPASVFLAEGSEILVRAGRKI